MNSHDEAVNQAVASAKVRNAKKPKPDQTVRDMFTADCRKWMAEFMDKSGKSRIHKFIVCKLTPSDVVVNLAFLAFENYKGHEMNNKYRIISDKRDRHFTIYSVALRSDFKLSPAIFKRFSAFPGV